MNGMDASTGTALSGNAHLAQSIGDILSTPIGTRVMLRDYGSLLVELMDRPINAATAMLMRAATATAIAQWEPRITLTRVQIGGTPAAGNLSIQITGTLTDQASKTQLAQLTIPIRRSAASS
ncbi:oxidoreductase [Novosphingobium sp. FSY-8]|uniref:Oxidoreductase n=1 Tax=Novosphingobium ovatum TaxID=1908523 RepID=A0ABW9XAI4_9SPHN|nr:GPW/gp25 family protein [Novosphingobium ovatum]NBC35538.1 oxidoreductase [Novosphingobium ovatum]